VVNEDQLSLAIGKRGQNVRLAARLTGWDIDILTPPEFQAGVQRVDTTLKSIEGITQEMVDKVIALGLIDVRDIEEVGTGPLMEELGLDEAKAEEVVTKCAEEAKVVATEQEAKKAAEAKAKAADRAAIEGARGAIADAGVNPLLNPIAAPVEAAEGSEDGNGDRMPGALEATEGMAPEITTHDSKSLADSSELSPEEQAISGVNTDNGKQEIEDETDQSAALAEGRTEPPAA
jgi:N utilization substance protein A